LWHWNRNKYQSLKKKWRRSWRWSGASLGRKGHRRVSKLIRSRDAIRIAKKRKITTRFENTVGLRKRARGRPHSGHHADPRTARQAGLSLQRGSNVTYFETGRRSAFSCYRISPRGRCDISRKSFDSRRFLKNKALE
jgi:hypothetical protein